jgi:hypothetical protein
LTKIKFYYIIMIIFSLSFHITTIVYESIYERIFFLWRMIVLTSYDEWIRKSVSFVSVHCCVAKVFQQWRYNASGNNAFPLDCAMSMRIGQISLRAQSKRKVLGARSVLNAPQYKCGRYQCYCLLFDVIFNIFIIITYV